MHPTSSYGKTRKRSADLSYGQIEAAAEEILASGVRPTVEGIRESLKAGSQRTLLDGLQRFWKELGARLSGVPDTRRRLPAPVADLADTLWQTALTLALESAEGSDATMQAQLAQLRTEIDVRSHALSQREIEMESLVRSRERTIRELEEHLRATMALVGKRDATIGSLETRLAASLDETESYRQRLATIVSGTVVRHRGTSHAIVHKRARQTIAQRSTTTSARNPPRPRASSTKSRSRQVSSRRSKQRRSEGTVSLE